MVLATHIADRLQRALTAHSRSLDTFLTTCSSARRSALVKAAARKPRARLASLAIPLGIAASIISMQWWALVPLGGCAWWWAPREARWTWVVAVGRGVITAEWALVGAYALEAFPGKRAVIAAAWLMAAMLLAVYAKAAR